MLTGKAPKGATLRLRKQFPTPTWEGSFIDNLNTTMKVGADGKYTWHVNQSTRPVVQDKLVEITEDEPVRIADLRGRRRPRSARSVDHAFTVTESGIDLLEVDLDWPTPDDLDLEVYKQERRRLADRGRLLGQLRGREGARRDRRAGAGDYVLRVDQLRLHDADVHADRDAVRLDARVSETVPGLIENWTMTCEKDGRVLQQESVVVNRGKQAKVNWSECAARW